MGEICGLKFYLSCVHTPQSKFVIEIPLCGNKGIFVTEFVILGKNPPFYVVNECVQKWVPACRYFENNFVVYVHIINETIHIPFSASKRWLIFSYIVKDDITKKTRNHRY